MSVIDDPLHGMDMTPTAASESSDRNLAQA